MGAPSLDYESMAKLLAQTGRYRVLKRLEPRRHFAVPTGSPRRLGMFLDLETTGLDPAQDEIIEIGMVPFTYSIEGQILEVGQPFSRLRQPRNPIPPAITALTGITDEMVAGQVIDPADVATLAASAAVVVAHNAAFDRKFAEGFCDVFKTKPWACSMVEIPWAEEGFEGTKLGYLLAGAGMFFQGHRAADDCLAAIELLARPLPKSGTLAFAKLLGAARLDTYRIWADRAPYAAKDVLKSRGYRWYDGSAGGQKAWYLDVPEAGVEPEITFLRQEIFGDNRHVAVDVVTALQRYSDRAVMRQIAAVVEPANDT